MAPQKTRRVFLRQMTGGAAALPVLAAFDWAGAFDAFAAPPGLAPGADEAYWEMVRRQFAFSDDRIPMNAANLCPSPRVVAERVARLTEDIDLDCSFPNRAKFNTLREESREKIAAYLNVSPDEIAIVRNTSEANNIINNGVALEPGDEVVLWDQNHPTNNVAWDVRAARFGIAVRRVSTPKQPGSTGELVDVFAKALGPKTKVLSITHVSNVSGIQLPAREIVEAAHRQGVYVHLDGAQSFGVLANDLRAIGCDSYSASSHKWFTGPKEAGVLYVRSERIPQIWPSVVAPGWGNDADPDVEGARKFESMGQRDDACLAAMGTTVDVHRAIGAERVEARTRSLVDALMAGLEAEGLSFVTPRDGALRAGVCILEVPGPARQRVGSALYEQYGISSAGSGGLRLSPHYYNTMAHIDRTVEAIKALRGLMVSN